MLILAYVVLSRGNSYLSSIISFVTRSEASHSGVLFKMNNKPFVLESVLEGVRIIDYETWRKTNIEIDRFPVSVDSYKLWEHVGKPYDFRGLIGWYFKDTNINDPKAFFCSELVAYILGLKSPGMISPGRLLSYFRGQRDGSRG